MKRLLIIIFLSFTVPLFSYYWEFGQNKVQYKNFDWKVIDKEHFSIIYYSGGEELAKFAEYVISETYDSLSQVLSHNLPTPVPIILYNSHNDFEQTNVTLHLIDEGTGGFTEIFKNRVVVPFDGSYAKFRHVLAHELVHVFQFSISRGSEFGSLLQEMALLFRIPLWFIEGMAEYFSIGWDTEADMVIRDALYWNRLKDIQSLHLIEGSYLMYKEGQSVIKFIADRYGEKKIIDIFRKVKRFGGINGAMKGVLGMGIGELNRLWIREIKKKYWAQCVEKNEEPENTRRLTHHQGYTFNTAPSISPKGNEIVFLSDRGGYESMYLMSSIDGRIKAKLIEGGKTKGFESLHIMHGGIGWHPNSKLIAFVAKSQGKDVLYIMDVHNKKIIKKFEPNVDRIFSPSFSPDGKFIAFRGTLNGKADICILDYNTGELHFLTSDIYDDLTPSWSFDGKYIVFSSDRPLKGEKWMYGKYTIFKIDVEEKIVIPQPIIKERTTLMNSPLLVRVKDSVEKLVYISNKNGTNNLYMVDIKDDSIIGEPLQLTNVIGGIFTPSISRDGELLVFSNYINLGWDVYIWKHPFKKGITPQAFRSYKPKYTQVYEDTFQLKSKNLGLRFTPDWGGGALSYSPGWGFIGNLRLAVSDLLGNHRFYLQTATPGNILANYYVSYFYLPKRMDFGIATFKDEYFYAHHYVVVPGDTIYRSKEIGIGILFSYPTDRFQRIDLELIGIKDEEVKYIYDSPEWKYIGTEWYYQTLPLLSWVYDNSMWGATGPINGRRCKCSIFYSLPIIHPSLLYNLYKIDLRKYIRVAPGGYVFAVRLINMGIWGEDADYMVETNGWPRLGGPRDLRGYEIGEFSGRNAGILNVELRYPFIEYLKIAFPIPLTIRGIKGVLFCDFGYAVNDIMKFRFFEEGRLKDLKFDFGVGMRLRFPYFVLKFDVAKNWDLIDLSSKTYLYFSLEPEF